MCVGAAAAWLVERRERAALLAKITEARFGFRCSAGGAWTWQLWQEPLYEEVDAVRGSAVSLCCEALGMPFVRRVRAH